MYIGHLIANNRNLWDAVVHHDIMEDMCNDTLPVDRFRDYIGQVRILSGQSVRSLLCRLLADCHPSHSIAGSVTGHIQSLQPGGDHFEAIAETLRSAGVSESTSVEALPSTQALDDCIYKIGVSGSVHEKILALSVLVEVTNARFEVNRKSGAIPTNPLFRMWFSHHASAVLGSRIQWLHAALDSSAKTADEDFPELPSDRAMFRRIVQWLILVSDDCRTRGSLEWPRTKYYHRRT